MKIYLLLAGYAYEGSKAIRAYKDETIAQDICTKLEKHSESRKNYDNYEQWKKECPVEGAEGYDYYSVQSIDVL